MLTSAGHNTSVTLSALDSKEVGHRLIYDCSVNVPTTENFIVGDGLILQCVVNTRAFTDSLFEFIWSSNNTELRSVKKTKRQDHHIISQLNTSNDGQEYVCEVIITRFTIANATETVNGTIELTLNGKPFIKLIACTICI